MSDNHDLLNDNDMYSFSGYEADDMCSNNGIDAYREYRVDTKGQYLKILEFKRFVKHFSFKKISESKLSDR